jgi:hypothetical protein
VDEVELVAVGGDREVVDADHVAVRMLAHRYHPSHLPAYAYDVLVMHPPGRERQLRRDHTPALACSVGLGQPVAVGGGQQVREPSGHA